MGAAAKYGTQALAIGTTVKLARALWIVPVSLLTATWMSRIRTARQAETASVKLPWFILFFCAAAALNTLLPRFAPDYAALSHLGKTGLTATLFLIGTSLSRRTLREVGIRPLLQGILLWVVVASVSLTAIYRGWISI